MSTRILVFLGLLAPAAGLIVFLMHGCGDADGIEAACRSNDDCAATELCATGLCEGGLGVCNERPTMCPDTDSPVCGCDGQTYQNGCFADMAGVRLARTGPCIPASS
jgi:hypothetical protein